jgi:drug/metabolite transporter (DMT)-like permease
MTGKARGSLLADRSPLLLAGLGAACISASAILVKLADTGTATAALYRCLLALPVLVPLALIEQRRLARGTPPGPPRQLSARAWAFVSGLFLGVDLVLWNHVIADVGAGVATVLGNLQVVFVTFAAWAVWHERPSRRVLVALPAVMASVVLVSGLVGRASGAGRPLAGIVFGVATSAAYATFLLIMRRTSAGTRHVAGPLAEATAGAAVSSVLMGLAFGGLQFGLGWSSLRWLLLLALTSQTIGWLLITSSLPRLPAAVSALTLLLQPAAALLLAAAVLGERPSLIQLAGAVVVCCGVVAVARAPATADSPAGSRPAARWRRPARRRQPGRPVAGDPSSAG